MVKVTYIEHGGAEHILDIEPGLSIMQGAVNNGVRGIIGDCGGACSCATCHVYIDPAWSNKTGERCATEEALLEEVCDVQTNSRLSCQVKITPDLDGLVVRLPVKQV